jgi:NTE family protein
MKKKIGFAFGGGGARGLAHIGVLKILEKEGIQADMAAGTSMGSIIGAAYALGMPIAEMEKLALGITRRTALRDLFDPCVPKQAMLKGQKVNKYINSVFDNAEFKNTRIPLKIVATDLECGDEVVLEKGNIADAVMASICVPGIFPPVRIGNKILIDGGVVNPTPVDVVADMGADAVIGIDLVMKRKIVLDKPSIITTLFQSYEIIRSHSVRSKLAGPLKNTVIIKPEMRGTIDSFKFHDIQKFIASGEKAAVDEMDNIRQLLK